LLNWLFYIKVRTLAEGNPKMGAAGIIGAEQGGSTDWRIA
jgi:hypothetical protein